MKNKRGFTLIEIIICIAIIAVVSVSSIVGFNIISKNIRISKLKDIEDEIMTAAQIYLETNNIAQQQLEEEGNSVILPLNVLVNEGLLDLSTTELDMDDISNEYVVAALGNYDGSTNCVGIKDGSWNLSSASPLYICTNTTSTGTSSNLSIIDPSSISNANKVSQEPFVFKGADPNNYITYKENTYRIYYIDTDDSMVLISDNSFGNTFDGKTDNLCGVPIITDITTNFPSTWGKIVKGSSGNVNNIITYNGTKYRIYPNSMSNIYSASKDFRINEETIFNSECNLSNDTNQKYLSLIDYFNTVIPIFTATEDDGDLLRTSSSKSYLSSYFNVSYLTDIVGSLGSDLWLSRITCTRKINSNGTISGYKIRLKSCMKIKSGTGAYQEPYLLDDSAC